MSERGRNRPWMGRGRRPTNPKFGITLGRAIGELMAGRGTIRGTHRAASSRWRFCARLNKFGIATSGSARASSSSAVRRPRPSPRPTSGDVTRRHAHRAQRKHHDELRNAARAPARESRGRSSRVDKRGYAPLETPPRQRTARVDAREARAPMCARCSEKEPNSDWRSRGGAPFIFPACTIICDCLPIQDILSAKISLHHNRQTVKEVKRVASPRRHTPRREARSFDRCCSRKSTARFVAPPRGYKRAPPTAY